MNLDIMSDYALFDRAILPNGSAVPDVAVLDDSPLPDLATLANDRRYNVCVILNRTLRTDDCMGADGTCP